MKLVNVRLGDRDARAVARLRAKGISISEVVRRALREAEQRASASEQRPEEVIAKMLERFPTPQRAPKRTVSALDRRAVQKLIRTRLRRPR